jgi:hypothetical protein
MDTLHGDVKRLDSAARSLVLCAFVAAVSVLLLFTDFHELMGHSTAIISAGIGGIGIGALSSRWAIRNASGRDMSLAGLGGVVGLALLHLLPLLH